MVHCHVAHGPPRVKQPEHSCIARHTSDLTITLHTMAEQKRTSVSDLQHPTKGLRPKHMLPAAAMPERRGLVTSWDRDTDKQSASEDNERKRCIAKRNQEL